jgi:sulfur-oxidizing protein SoxY
MTTTIITAKWNSEPIAHSASLAAGCPAVAVNRISVEPADGPGAPARRGRESTHGKISTPETSSARLENSACRKDLALEKTKPLGVTRRTVLTAAVAGSAGFASAALASSPPPNDDAVDLVKKLTGKTPTTSDRLHLMMPQVFPNGYTVPLTLVIDSPMTDSDHVRHVSVVAPRNPLVEVATFHFVPQRSEPRVSTRIRLAEPQYVLAVAEMNDGTLLMTETWVEVATNGCK